MAQNVLGKAEPAAAAFLPGSAEGYALVLRGSEVRPPAGLNPGRLPLAACHATPHTTRVGTGMPAAAVRR